MGSLGLTCDQVKINFPVGVQILGMESEILCGNLSYTTL
jgi:hypothetical protein